MTIAKVKWNSWDDVDFCLAGGITDTFRNQVTLIVGDTPDDSKTIHNHLQENCGSTSTTSPNAAN